MNHRVLIIEEDEAQLAHLASVVRRQGNASAVVASGARALELLGGGTFDVIVADLDVPTLDALELCRTVTRKDRSARVVLCTAHPTQETAVDALRAGAADYVARPFDEDMLAACVARAGEAAVIERELERLERDPSPAATEGVAIGSCPAMKRLNELVGRVASTDANVLIRGETGTGKELVARAIHARSARAKGPFVALNCAAVPVHLLESELFGHTRGAFTDASHEHKGLCVQANHGTLLLDEIGEMPLELQPKFLRALQERCVRPLGSNHEVPFDARILAATNRDLEREVAHKRFRDDLFYRIDVVRIEVPPLRDRGMDVLAIAHSMLRRLSGGPKGEPPLTLSRPAAELLLAYEWPGNVRELENCIERAVAVARFRQIIPEDLPEKLQRHLLHGTESIGLTTLAAFTDRYVHEVVDRLKGNTSEAARILGVDRRTLYRRLGASPDSDPNVN